MIKQAACESEVGYNINPIQLIDCCCKLLQACRCCGYKFNPLGDTNSGKSFISPAVRRSVVITFTATPSAATPVSSQLIYQSAEIIHWGEATTGGAPISTSPVLHPSPDPHPNPLSQTQGESSSATPRMEEAHVYARRTATHHAPNFEGQIYPHPLISQYQSIF